MIPPRTDRFFPLLLALGLGMLLSACQSPDTTQDTSKAGMSTVSKESTDSRLLEPCPSAPHCVSSLATDEDHYVAPLPGAGNRADSLTLLEKVLDPLPRVQYQRVGPARLNAQFTSLIFRFTDDVNFYVHEDGRIDVRSSSRIGYYDFGVNRGRVEDLRKRLQQRLNQHTAGAGAT